MNEDKRSSVCKRALVCGADSHAVPTRRGVRRDRRMVHAAHEKKEVRGRRP